MRFLALLFLLTGCAPDATTGFTHIALSGTHADLSCTDCHGDSTSDRAAWQCATCHEASRPDSHDPGECGQCHTTDSWATVNIDHTPFFPIPHRGVDACSDCHPDATDRTVFTCTDCHEQARTDNQHQGEVSNYVFESTACLNCHPTGRAEEGEGGDD